MDRLRFRRQFLLTPIKNDELDEWQTEAFDDYLLYVHPDCQLKKSIGTNLLYLIGYFFDPHRPQKSSQDILDELSEEKSIDNYPERLYRLVGRFVLIIKQENDFIIFNDACGLKSCYYTKFEDKIFAASQPLLIGQVLKIKRTDAYSEYFNSAYVRGKQEHWLPSGVSFYENVHHLVPNHYLRLSANTQTRYFPHKQLAKKNYADLVTEFSSLLKQIVETANKHMDLAFSLTAGWDSRILLGSSKQIVEDVIFYTLRYRNMGDDHNDIRIPRALSESLKLDYRVFDCEKKISQEFAEIYGQNSEMAHLDDWGKIAYGMSLAFPKDKVAVKGNCSEIGRCFYYPSGKHKKSISLNDFLNFELGWDKMHFIRHQVDSWLKGLLDKKTNFGYDLYDLFYWEHRMGSWQAQSQLEWDIVQEVFTPFNSRELLDLLLSVPASKRKAYHPDFYIDSMHVLWKDVLKEPINPVSLKGKLRRAIVQTLRRVGVLTLMKRLVRR